MTVRRVPFAFVSAAFLAAFATSCGTSFASPASNADLARAAYADMQQGDTASAIEKFTTAIESRELDANILANALLNRAAAYQQLGKHAHAIDDYTAALNVDAMSPSLRSTALYNRGLSQQKVGKLAQAVEDFTGALLLNPEFAQAYYSRANALRDAGQLLFALSDYDRAVRYKHPDLASVYYGSATTYLALKRPQDARRAFNSALALNPKMGQARAQLVMLGDENAKAEQLASADDITTGSVGALAGGTVALKPDLPKAVEPPPQLLQASASKPVKAPKQFTDRVPVEQAQAAADAPEEVVATEQVATTDTAAPAPTVDDVPAIPEPQTADAADAADVPAAADQPADSMTTASIAHDTQTGWVVQLASAASEDAAHSTWAKMQARFGVLKKKQPAIVRADLGDKGVFYRIRLGGFEDQAAAKSECKRLKANKVTCYVSKAGG